MSKDIVGKEPLLLDNLELHKEEGFVAVNVNPKFYPLNIVYSASYIFLDRAYLLLDGDPDDEIRVILRPIKKGEDLEILGRDFNNELLNYAVYKQQAADSREIKGAIIAKALETNSCQCFDEEKSNEEDFSDVGQFHEEEYDLDMDKDSSFEDDPLGIAIPWEEKYSKEKKGKTDD